MCSSDLRPERRNAVNNALCNGLHEAWLRLNAGDDRVAILTNAGADFSVGNDVKEPSDDFARCVPGIGVRLQKPLIVAPSGWVIGGALCIVQLADLCVASDDARFGYVDIRFGSGVVSMFLPWVIGVRAAKELLFTGEDRIDRKSTRLNSSH